MIVVVHGATGAQGRPVVRRLTAGGHTVRALARRPDPARIPDGAVPVHGDAADPDALARAYDGADAVVVVLPGGAADDVAVAQADAILTALNRARVPRAVFNAGGGVWDDPPGIPFLDARTRMVTGLPEAVAVPVVVAPAGGLMENFSETWILERLRRDGQLVNTMPADALTRPVAMQDVADAIATVLTEDAPPPRVLVSGPTEVTGNQVAAAVATHRGRPVTWTTIPQGEYLAGVATGLGRQYADNIAALYGAGVDVPPPSPAPAGTRHITGTTTLASWIPTQSWP